MTFYSASQITNCNKKKKSVTPVDYRVRRLGKDSGMPRHERVSALYHSYICHLLVLPVSDCGLIFPSLYEFIHIKWHIQPTRCNKNGLLIIPISSTCFARWFRPSSGTLVCVYIIPLVVTHSLVLLKMGKMIARNMLSWLELLISRYYCI